MSDFVKGTIDTIIISFNCPIIGWGKADCNIDQLEDVYSLGNIVGKKLYITNCECGKDHTAEILFKNK